MIDIFLNLFRSYKSLQYVCHMALIQFFNDGFEADRFLHRDRRDSLRVFQIFDIVVVVVVVVVITLVCVVVSVDGDKSRQLRTIFGQVADRRHSFYARTINIVVLES